VKSTVCKNRDIHSTSKNPNDTCDAVSLAFTFTAPPAKIKVAWDPGPKANPCTPATDPATDSCD
jgi:hypothetical protein